VKGLSVELEQIRLAQSQALSAVASTQLQGAPHGGARSRSTSFAEVGAGLARCVAWAWAARVACLLQ
jgi:hypothetical protein